MKKRVVIDVTSCVVSDSHPRLSGIGRTTLELVRALERREDLPFELTLWAQLLKRERLKRYHFMSNEFYLPCPSWGWVSALKRKMPFVETLTGADLYHIPQNHAPFYYGEKTVLTIHDAMIFELREDHLYHPEEKCSLKRDAERCRAILTCSHSSKRLLLKHLEIPQEKITVAPWGYAEDTFYPQEKKKVREQLLEKYQIQNPYLFSVSCDVGRKRTPELVRQYLRCIAKVSDYPYDLVLVWHNPPADVLSQITSSPVGHRIKLLHAVSDNDLALLYNGATCMVFPSTYEGFGLPLLESMACGTPIMTTKETSLPEIGGNAGIYFDTLDEEEIGEKMMLLADNKFDLRKLSALCLLQAKQFSWNHCAEKTISVYESVLA